MSCRGRSGRAGRTAPRSPPGLRGAAPVDTLYGDAQPNEPAGAGDGISEVERDGPVTPRTRWRSARSMLRLGRHSEEQTSAPPRLSEVPSSVGIIMDGNGRWARGRRLPV